MQQPPPHLGLRHAAIFVADLVAARHFYVDLLGFTVEWEPDASNVYLTSGADNLALHQADPDMCPGTASKSRRRSGQLDHLGIFVAQAEEVQNWEHYLAAAGVPIVATTRKHRDGATSCYVRDPSGCVLQILHRGH